MPRVLPHRPPQWVTEWTLALLIGAGVAILRWLTLDFDNDYFMHVAWAAEIRLGELPVRDFVEPGFALQTLISFALIKLFGYQMAAEGIVACALIGTGAACTYAICRRLGLSRTVSATAAILTGLTYPRLYAYPKAFVYPTALLALTIHVGRPRKSTLALLALVTAVAFLLRHDHGIYVAIPTLGAVWFAAGGDWPARCRAIGSYAGLALLFTLPWMAWITVSGHHEQYVRALAGQGADAVTRFNIPEHGLHIDTAAPLIALDPPPDPEVTGWWPPAQRVRLLPGLLNEANALTWLTWATFALPGMLLVVEAVRAARVRRELSDTTNVAVLATCAMAIIGYQTLVRGSPDSRLGDVASLTWIAAACLATLGWKLKGPGRRPTRIAICLLLGATAASAVVYGRVPVRLEKAGVDGPTSALRRAEQVLARYKQHPLEVFAPPDAAGLSTLARWLHECTFPRQRVAVIGFEPEINVWAERGFAGGLAYFHQGWMSDPPDQRIALDRWRTQDAPFVLLMTTEADAFRKDYGNVSSWVADRYTPVQTSTFGGNKEVTVLLNRDAAVRSTHARTNLPCLTGSPSGGHATLAE